jgi:Flp pilus assembly protein TadG
MKTTTRDRARGGAAVEFALVLPLFMALVMGALDYGYFFYVDQITTNAAREGARSGALVDPAATGAQATALANAKAVAEDYLTQNSLPTVGVTASVAMVIGSPAIVVEISRPFRSLTGFTSIVVPANIFAHAIMRWQ